MSANPATQTISTVTADPPQRRMAMITIGVLAGAFVIAAPFARTPLAPCPPFIPAYETALIIIDLTTVVLLLGQFANQRSLPPLLLTAGYFFDACMVVPHALSFPGLLTPTGWLSGGSQTTAWLYMFWHAGFPLFVIAYVYYRRHPSGAGIAGRNPVIISLALVSVLVVVLTWVGVNSSSLLPEIMAGNSYTPAMKFVIASVWFVSLAALLVLVRNRPYSVLDLWLIVVMVSWLFDIALSAALNGGRYDLGFYGGRLYGLCAAAFVLIVILVESGKLYGQLALASHELQNNVHELDNRVRERTRELAATNRRLEAILEASPVGIFMLDLEGKVLLWTPSAERVFGYTAAEAVGRTPPYLTDQTTPEFRSIVAQVATDPNASGFLETRRARKDGNVIDVSVRWACVDDELGGKAAIMFAVADHTEMKKMELQLRQAQKMEAIGNLTGGMAHDFNNLLGIIIGNIDLLVEVKDNTPEQDELAREALGAALRGADLTKRLLAFARKQPLQPQATDINELVQNMAHLLGRTLGEDISIALELGDDMWTVVIDPTQLESSLTNLANNARDAMPGGGQITIATSNSRLDQDYTSRHTELAPGDYALVEVIDTGTGMPPEVAARIFEPFYTTKTEGKGTGLGLSMVFGFIKQSGGHINVYSEEGIGTTFRLYLPRAEDGTQRREAAHNVAVLVGRGERVLAVEDNPALRRTLVRQLNELGYRVWEAENAEVAMEFLNGERVDLLLSDVVMPGVLGVGELARRASERWPDLKLLLTSGFPENRINHDPHLQTVRFLRKPYRREELARAIREVLEE